MNLAKQINQKLDEMLEIRDQLSDLRAKCEQGLVVKNSQTGKQASTQEVLSHVDSIKKQIEKELNQITNNGLNVKEIFTNKYYINDVMQDKELVKQDRAKERNKPTDPNAEFISWEENS